MLDVIVVGGGIFGCIITKKLRSMGMCVQLIDQEKKGAGSKPAACLIKPSWISSLGKEVTVPAMELLRDLYDVQDIKFKTSVLSTTVHWIDPRTILSETKWVGEIKKIHPDNGVELHDGTILRARHLIVAAGIWTNDILPEEFKVEGLVGRTGVAYTWKGQTEPVISVWAPYRQLVAFNRTEDEIWVGDGSAIDPKNWNSQKELKSLYRCANLIDRPPEEYKDKLVGIRPYVPNAKPCYLANPQKGLWVVTGGAKNGTLAAGWSAHMIAKELIND